MAETKHADPTALGLLGLAIATLVASSAKLGWTSGEANIIPWVIFLGGFGQIIAGTLDFKRANVFGGTVFCGFGLFWLGVSMTWLTGLNVFGETAAANADAKQLGFAFLGYLIFALTMTIAAAEINKVLCIIFVLLDVLFLGLTLAVFGISPKETMLMAGIAEFLVALFSFYGAAAGVLNSYFDREFLPFGKPLGIFK